MKIRTVAQPSASAESAAPVATRGANAQSPQVTRFGLDFPRNISRIYAKVPVRPNTAEISTSQCAREISNKKLLVSTSNTK